MKNKGRRSILTASSCQSADSQVPPGVKVRTRWLSGKVSALGPEDSRIETQFYMKIRRPDVRLNIHDICLPREFDYFMPRPVGIVVVGSIRMDIRPASISITPFGLPAGL
ncbi:hypothetical protein AVEN_4629-1 [Araneus ventricosus]|uniref:Uncharacterized protein n=1 Tax=Araneus ventricosus TaxID=182803 RepID=A0A4Y2H4F4_ARAVE|nr:hypothetical protein AVEN_4629-1 [Araneus ventricosus]